MPAVARFSQLRRIISFARSLGRARAHAARALYAALAAAALVALAIAGQTAAAGRRPSVVRAPTISGAAVVGSLLRAHHGSWSRRPGSYAYAWKRCDGSGRHCKAIAHAHRSSYRLTARDVGSTLRVAVAAASRAGRAKAALSAHTAVVAASASAPAAPAAPSPAGGVQHLEYVFNDGPVEVYDIDNSFKLVETFTLPGTNRGVRGIDVSPATHMMFVSYGGDGGASGNGSVLAYDLVAKRVAWSVNLSSGIDSGAVNASGSLLYMPDGENSSDGIWNVLSTANGSVVGKIETRGKGPHDGTLSADGKVLLAGDRNYDFLSVYNTLTGKIEAEVGPLVGGVRPNTINGSDTIAFTTATGFDGFQVERITPPGAVLYTENFGTCSGPFTTCSHGVSLSPESRQAYVIDAVHKAVQVWDVHGVGEGIAPVHLATVPVAGLSGGEEGCAYDCGRDGWLQHSLDGRYVFVGDSGDVIETATQKVVAQIPTLLNTRKFLEVDWAGGVPVATSSREGIGR